MAEGRGNPGVIGIVPARLASEPEARVAGGSLALAMTRTENTYVGIWVKGVMARPPIGEFI